MTFDIAAITASKEARRQRLAALPYGEKLQILEAMRDRDNTLRRARLIHEPRQAKQG